MPIADAALRPFSEWNNLQSHGQKVGFIRAWNHRECLDSLRGPPSVAVSVPAACLVARCGERLGKKCSQLKSHQMSLRPCCKEFLPVHQLGTWPSRGRPAFEFNGSQQCTSALNLHISIQSAAHVDSRPQTHLDRLTSHVHHHPAVFIASGLGSQLIALRFGPERSS